MQIIHKTLIIYTGGTFGMIEDKISKCYKIDPKRKLKSILKSIDEFNDKEERKKLKTKFLISKVILNKRIQYNIL